MAIVSLIFGAKLWYELQCWALAVRNISSWTTGGENVKNNLRETFICTWFPHYIVVLLQKFQRTTFLGLA